MSLENVRKNWEKLAAEDPLWAVLTDPSKRGRKWKLDDFLETGEQQVQLVMKKMGDLGIGFPTGKAMDFGCGVGRLTRPLAARFGEVYGVDISSRMVNLAREYVKEGNCHFIVNTRDDLSMFQDGEFDFVLSMLTLQHVKPVHSMKYVSDFIRVLSPRGAAFFTLPEYLPRAGRGSAPLRMLEDRLNQFRRYPSLETLLQLRSLANRLSSSSAKMENHFVPREVVSHTVLRCGGRVIAHEPIRDALSYLTTGYFVAKA